MRDLTLDIYHQIKDLRLKDYCPKRLKVINHIISAQDHLAV